jgi:hypothetical protein
MCSYWAALIIWLDAIFALPLPVTVRRARLAITSTVDIATSAILPVDHATHIPFASLARRATTTLRLIHRALLVQKSVVPAVTLLVALNAMLATFTTPISLGVRAVPRAAGAAQIVLLVLSAILASYYIMAHALIAHKGVLNAAVPLLAPRALMVTISRISGATPAP